MVCVSQERRGLTVEQILVWPSEPEQFADGESASAIGSSAWCEERSPKYADKFLDKVKPLLVEPKVMGSMGAVL
jgi:hypothetical protein